MTFTTDFGSGSPLVAAMKGVVLAGCPAATLVDVSHEVPRFDVSAGAFMLFAGTRHFGGGSVHLAVVDPGVGSTRRRLIVQAGGRFYIGPDNGLFAIVIDEVGMQAVHELAPRPHGAPTFEGRDVFAPAAAALASGVPLSSLGPATDPPVGLPDGGPRVLWTDGFGNLVTNLKPPARKLRIHGHDIVATAKTYSEARPGEAFVYVGSMGYLEVGVREARADRLLGARSGMRVETIQAAPFIVGEVLFGSFGVFFVFCYLRPESSAARFFMNGPRYPRILGRNGFIFLAGLCFLGCVAGLSNR